MSFLWLSRGPVSAPCGQTITLELRVDALANCHLRSAQVQWPTTVFAVNEQLQMAVVNTDADSALVTEIAQMGAGTFLYRMIHLDLDIMAIAAPWDSPVYWSKFLREERRTLIISAQGFLGPSWLDGPLAHVTAKGELASYLPAGGPGGLLLPLNADSDSQGYPLSKAVDLEADLGERAHRCLVGATRSLLSHRGHKLEIRIEQLTRLAAVTLVLIRQAFPNLELLVQLPDSFTSKWTRLLQNLNITQAATVAEDAFTIPGPSPLLKDAHCDAVAAAINQISDVIPRTL